MLRISTLFLLLSLLASLLWSQPMPGLQSSNYAGVFGLDLQPANLADSRLAFDLSLVGISQQFNNNYLSLDRADLGDLGNLTRENYPSTLRNLATGTDRYLNQQLDVYPLSLMLALSAKNGLAITLRNRSFMQANGLNEEMGYALYEVFGQPSSSPFYNQPLSLTGFNFLAVNYSELGIGFGQTVLDVGRHFLKVGGRAKFIAGTGAVYLDMQRADIAFPDANSVVVQDVNVAYGLSQNLDGSTWGQSLGFANWFQGNRGFGADLGLVYEFRPENRERVSHGNVEHRFNLVRGKNQYRLKVGVSLLDIGRVRFRQSEFAQRFAAQNRRLSTTDWDEFEGFDDVNAYIDENFTLDQGAESFSVALPRAFSLQADWRLANPLYLNFTMFSYLQAGQALAAHGVSNYTLTPRLETPGFELGLPVSLRRGPLPEALPGSDQALQMGLYLRLGPLLLGSGDLITNMVSRQLQSAQVFFALHIPVAYGKED